MPFELDFIWAGLIAFAVLAYVIFDGFDLGIGILFPFFPREEDRKVMMNSVAPVWDGNETWLVLGGGGLMAVFPLAYAVVLPALYAPIIAMLLGLIFRGVAFEFRWRSVRNRHWWDRGFALGSTVAALGQGIALGALVQGIPVANRAYAGGWWDWLTPFSLLTGLALVIGYMLLGATWLILKCEGDLQERLYGFAWFSAVGTFALIGLVSIWTPFLEPTYMENWFSWPRILYTSVVPLLLLACAWVLYAGLAHRRDVSPFLASIGLFVVSFIGIGISFYPFIVPPSITIAEAAAPPETLLFLLVGAAILIPIILAYTGMAYWVFRGKVDPEGHYH